MLSANDNGHAWMNATPEDRRTLCEDLAPRTGRDAEFLFHALNQMYNSSDARVRDRRIEDMAKVSVAAMHVRPS